MITVTVEPTRYERNTRNCTTVKIIVPKKEYIKRFTKGRKIISIEYSS